MNQVKLTQHATQSAALSSLATETLVKTARHTFLAGIREATMSGLGPSSGEMVLPESFSRVGLRASAYVAPLVAESFRISDCHLIQEATVASLYLDAFSHAVDDLTDEAEIDPAAYTHLASLCLGKAARMYACMTGRDQNFWDRWERHLKEASEAERELWRHHKQVSPFSHHDFSMMGQKSALIKMSASLYASVTGRWDLINCLEEGLMFAATGMQLIDDLLDWQEDYKSGIFTYAVTLAHHNSKEGQSLGESINSLDVVVDILDRATMSLDLAKERFTRAKAIQMSVLIASLTDRLSQSKKHFEYPQTVYPEIPTIDRVRWVIGPLAH